MDTKTSQVLRERIINVLPRIGLPAARPLSVALLSDDPEVQYVCVNSLAQIGYPLSLPNLKDLMERPNVLAKVKEAARVAIVAIDANAIGKTSAELFYDLALKYYYGRESLAPDARYETANVWYWQEGQGLSYRPVPRPVFNDIYAMRNAALTLKHDPTFYDAVSLWLAAHFKKEADMPKGAKDPTVTPTDMSAEYYALASSAKYLQDVLERGLKDQNSAVAVGAIRALDRTAGTKNLVAVLPGGVQPLVKALTYPDRNVRFMAAVTLAKSLPAETFSGVDLVAPVLNEALRQTGVKRVLLVVSDEKTRNTLKDAARAAGYDIVEEVDPGKAIGAARDSAGVDLAVLAEKPSAIDFISRLRADPVFAALPAVVMDQTQEFARFAQKDKRSVVIEKLDAPNITKALAAGLQIGTGQPLSTEDASAWAVKSADAIRTLGMTNNPVLDVARTRASLVAALGDKRPEVQIASAGALAMMIAADAQRAIAKLTVDAQAPEKVRIAAFGSLCESIKKFGNQLTDDQAQAVLDVVNDTKASRDLRNAAAAALGAMNLPSEKIKTLIPIQAGI
jgi:CheY-like chemotaxis protein